MVILWLQWGVCIGRLADHHLRTMGIHQLIIILILLSCSLPSILANNMSVPDWNDKYHDAVVKYLEDGCCVITSKKDL